MISRFRIVLVVSILVLQSACGGYQSDESEGQAIAVPEVSQLECADSVLDAAGRPISTVGERLLHLGEDGYYTMVYLASAQVLESYPEKIHIVRLIGGDAQVVPVSKLLPFCQVKQHLLNMEVRGAQGEWLAAKFVDFQDSDVMATILNTDREVLMDFKSVRFSLQGDTSESN